MNWNECVTYEAETGNLIWKERPPEHFDVAIDCQRWNVRFKGKVAGWRRKDKNGRRICTMIGTNHHKPLPAHRVIWEMHNGPIPEGIMIDHKDRDPWNNKMDNLRLATPAQNRSNALNTRNSSGYKGVYWSKMHSKWYASICCKYKRTFIGLFDDLKEAAMAYNEQAKELHGEFAKLNEIA